jgi:xanthine/uracil permease
MPSTLTPARAILYGGLTVGALDLLDAFAFFYLRSGARPIGILHSIASGALGPAAARAGGPPTAALGFVLHFLIAFIIVSIYFMASRFLPVLRRQPVLCGIAYGVVAYFVMTYAVVPMSNARSGGPFVLPVFINGILIHMFGVGLPSALYSSRVRA